MGCRSRNCRSRNCRSWKVDHGRSITEGRSRQCRLRVVDHWDDDQRDREPWPWLAAPRPRLSLPRVGTRRADAGRIRNGIRSAIRSVGAVLDGDARRDPGRRRSAHQLRGVSGADAPLPEAPGLRSAGPDVDRWRAPRERRSWPAPRSRCRRRCAGRPCGSSRSRSPPRGPPRTRPRCRCGCTWRRCAESHTGACRGC